MRWTALRLAEKIADEAANKARDQARKTVRMFNRDPEIWPLLGIVGVTVAGGYYYLSHKPVGKYNPEEKIKQIPAYAAGVDMKGEHVPYVVVSRDGTVTPAHSSAGGMHVSVPVKDLPKSERK